MVLLDHMGQAPRREWSAEALEIQLQHAQGNGRQSLLVDEPNIALVVNPLRKQIFLGNAIRVLKKERVRVRWFGRDLRGGWHESLNPPSYTCPNPHSYDSTLV